MSKNFHEHLDKCRQCRDHPFDLCPAGTVILQMEVSQGSLGGITTRSADRIDPIAKSWDTPEEDEAWKDL